MKKGLLQIVAVLTVAVLLVGAIPSGAFAEAGPSAAEESLYSLNVGEDSTYPGSTTLNVGENATNVGDSVLNVGQNPTDPSESDSEMGETSTDPSESDSEMGEIPTDPSESDSEVGEIPTDPSESDSEMGESPTDPSESDSEMGESPTDPSESTSNTGDVTTASDESEPDVPQDPGGSAGEGVKWTLSAEGELILSGTGAMTDFASYTDVPWRQYVMKIKKVTINEGVTSVGDNSFAMCPNLKRAALPEGIKKIGVGAFEKCYSLDKIEIPNSVTEIAGRAFYECTALEEFDIALNNSKLTSIGDGAFTLCLELENFNVPKSLRSIGESAFVSCTSITELILSDKLEHLGAFAFENCTSLEKINVPWQITNLPDFLFFGCRSLREVTFSRDLKTVGREAFLWCESLTELYLPHGVEEMPRFSYGYYYFNREYIPYGDRNLISSSPAAAEYAGSNGIKFIYDDPDHVCEMPCIYCGRCTCEDCTYYTCYDRCEGHELPITGEFGEGFAWTFDADRTLTVSGTGNMGDFTFNEAPWAEFCPYILRAVVSEGITAVGAYAFEGAVSLESAELPEGLTRLGFKAFYGCKSLGEITIPAGVETLPSYAFAKCESLGSVTFSEGLREIMPYVFSGCTSLKKAELPRGFEIMGANAFERCDAMTEAWLPATTRKPGKYALGYIYTADRRYIKIEGFTLYGEWSEGNASYAEENGFEFIRTDIHRCTDACPMCGRCMNSDCEDPVCARKCDAVCIMPFDNPYTDISEADWYYDGVKYTTQKGIMSGMGDGFFAPGDSFTRAQLVVVLWRLEDCPDPLTLAPFLDLEADWYVAAVSWAYENGIVSGVSETSFEPGSPITREQTAAIFMRYCALVRDADTSARADTSSFADAESVSSYATEAMSWAVAEGLITGSDEDGVLYLLPTGGTTRAQAATVITRFIRKGI